MFVSRDYCHSQQKPLKDAGASLLFPASFYKDLVLLKRAVHAVFHAHDMALQSFTSIFRRFLFLIAFYLCIASSYQQLRRLDEQSYFHNTKNSQDICSKNLQQ